MIFRLKQYDKTLIRFNFTSETFNGEKCEIIEINDNNKDFLPLGMECTNSGLLLWLKSRIIPKNREFVDALLAKNGLSHKDTIGIIKICKGLSVNDSYWIVEDDFDGKFKDYNLYKNKFATTLALIAYTGYGSIKAKGFTSSPEFTTNGMLRKGWRRLNNEIYLYKGGTSGAANTGKEPYSEFYASQIAKQMELDHIDYSLAKWKGSLCSTCKLFTDIDTSYVPIYRLVKEESLLAIGDYFKELGQDFYDHFVDMLIFDALIFNTDRHAGNFGVLVDNKTNKPIKFAPIFDNGLSLFNYAMDDEIDNLEEYAKTRRPAMAASYEDIVKTFISARQKEQLRRMINFKFKAHTTYNMSSKRVKSIEKYLQRRVQYLLSI